MSDLAWDDHGLFLLNATIGLDPRFADRLPEDAAQVDHATRARLTVAMPTCRRSMELVSACKIVCDHGISPTVHYSSYGSRSGSQSTKSGRGSSMN